MLSPVRTSAPAAMPISIDEAKLHLRVDQTDDDDLIASLIQAATDHLDGWAGILGRCLVTQSWQMGFCCWPLRGIIRLPFPDVTAATVKYFDEDDTEQSVENATVQVLSDVRGSFIRFSDEFIYPGLCDDRADSVQVTFTAGYGDASAVPTSIRAAILLLVGHWYANREAVAADAAMALPMGVATLLAPYRRIGV